MKTNGVQIGRHRIGAGHPCYLIAEVGTTCLGNLAMALDLVAAAAAAGMDAVKFQMIDPDQLSDPSVMYKVVVNGAEQHVNMKDMFSRLSFSDAEWREISDACQRRGVEFFATVDHLAGVDRLENLGVPAHKMGAWDVTYRPLVEKIARTGKPMFVDLGPATEAELDALIDWFRGAGGEVVMCMHDFHTSDAAQMNMKAITHLSKKYPWPVGFSSPNRDDDLDFVALALGVAHIEKRLILDRNLKAFHAHESLEPDELNAWSSRIRRVETALGQEAIIPSDIDRDQAREHYRSACTMSSVRAGEEFTAENLDGKRPGTGIPASRLPELWGRRAVRDLPDNQLISESDIL